MANSIKINLEFMILETVKTGEFKGVDIMGDTYSSFTSKALSINKKAFDIWKVFFEKDIKLDYDSLTLINYFYDFISNIESSNESLYLNCISLLSNYLDACINSPRTHLSLVK